MKIKKIIIPALLLVLAACGSKTSNNPSVLSVGDTAAVSLSDSLKSTSVSSNGNTELSNSSISNPSSSNGVSIPVGPEIINDWKAETKTVMMSWLGEVLPVAPLTTDYELEEDLEQDCIYIDDYIDAVDAYANILEDNGYEYDGDNYDETEDYESSFFVKSKSDSGLIVIQLGYYSTYGVTQIIAWVETELILENDVSIYGMDVTPSYDDKESPEININGFKFFCVNVMESNNWEIQMKSVEGFIYNKTAATPIAEIIIHQTKGQNNGIGVFKVWAGNSMTELTEIDGKENVFDLNGARFFKIGCKGTSYAESIDFIFVK